MTNNERFNQLINASSDPRLMLETLRALAPLFRAMKAKRDAQNNEQQKGDGDA